MKERTNLCKRLITDFSLSTSKLKSISTRFSSDLAPQRAIMDDREDGDPKVLICVVLGLDVA